MTAGEAGANRGFASVYMREEARTLDLLHD